MRTLKVAICIPAYGDVHAHFMQSVCNMLVYSISHCDFNYRGEPCTIEINQFLVRCSMLTESRHKLVAEALHWGADYMLCLDADHVFPHDTLMRLLSHGLPAVGCNYPRRITPTSPTAAASGGGLLYTTEEKAKAGLVEECQHLGFGVVLFDTRIFDVMQRHSEDKGEESMFPLFKFEPTPEKVGMIGEDVYFFRRLAEAGIKCHVDHGLSWEVGHIHEQLLTNAHTVAHKEKWEAEKERKRERYSRRAAELEAQADQRSAA